MKKKLTALVLALMLMAGATAALAQEQPEVPAQEAPETTVEDMTNAALAQRMDDIELMLNDITAILDGNLYPDGTQTFPYASEAEEDEIAGDWAYGDEYSAGYADEYADEDYQDETYADEFADEAYLDETYTDDFASFTCGVPNEGGDMAGMAIEDRIQGIEMMIMDMRAFLGITDEIAQDMTWDEDTAWEEDLQWSDETGWNQDPAGEDTSWMEEIPDELFDGDTEGLDGGYAFDGEDFQGYAEDGTDVTLADLMARIEALEAQLNGVR